MTGAERSFTFVAPSVEATICPRICRSQRRRFTPFGEREQEFSCAGAYLQPGRDRSTSLGCRWWPRHQVSLMLPLLVSGADWQPQPGSRKPGCTVFSQPQTGWPTKA